MDIGRKLGAVPPLGGAGSASNTMSPGPRSTSVPSGTPMYPTVWPTLTSVENWGAVPPLGGELGPHLTQSRLGRGLPPYQVASYAIQSFGHNGYGPKIGGAVLLLGGARSPSKTMWPGPRPTCIPSLILIRPTVWPQYTNVTDRQTDRTGQRSNSIGWTVLQMVTQNHLY